MKASFIKLVTVANPAAGAEFTLRPGGSEWWRVVSIAWTFTTDANVANRAVALTADDGTDVFWRAGPAALQAAGQAGQYCAYAGTGTAQTTGGVSTYPLPFGGLWLQSGWRLQTATDLAQVGDQYSAIRALVEEYDTGPRADVRAPILGVPFFEGS